MKNLITALALVLPLAAGAQTITPSVDVNIKNGPLKGWSWHLAPSASAYEVRWSGPIGQFSPGLGAMGWLENKAKTFDFGLGAYGSALGFGTADPGYALTLAPYVGYAPIGIAVGPLVDFANVNAKFGASGLFQGFTWKKNTGFVVCLTPQFFAWLHRYF